ncbi:MAG: FAD-dependent oxidoreductase [Bacillota bacterium]
MGNDRYNVIVVGAGIAGITTAYLCAKSNLSVALIERGEFPGSKNMFGGVIYKDVMDQIIPAFWEEAPLERAITEDILWFMEQDSVVKMGFTGLRFAQAPYNKFTTIRSRFDQWYANKAEAVGVHLMTSTIVDDLIYEKKGITRKKVSGVVLENGEKIYSEVVVLAEGIVGNLTQKAGLIKEKDTDSMVIYTKELLRLSVEKINDRFQLEDNEGANIAVVGYPTSGVIGKGGIFINKNTISIVVGAYLNQLINNGFNPYQLLARFKEHPLIKRLINGSESIEYQAKLIPKGNETDRPPLFSDGILIVGDALMMASSQGTAFAIMSGKCAAETVIQTSARGEFDKKNLSIYAEKLNQTYIMQNIMSYKKSKDYYREFPDADLILAKTINEIAYEFSNFNMTTIGEKTNLMVDEFKKIQPITKSIVDFYNGIRNWKVL